ncbi:MAG TPA: DUF4126 domain-containing protein [Thermoanaerobaculia bacterium]
MTPILTGLGLAAAAGLNCWAVLVVAHGLVLLLPQEFPGPTAEWLAHPAVFQIALALFVVEFLVDKIPFLDRLWDVGHTLLRPAVGIMLALAAAPPRPLPGMVGIALLAGAVTLGTHLAKSTSRLTSTAATRGFAQFAMSLAEDVVAVALAVLLFFVPWFAAVFLVGLALALFLERRRVLHSLKVLFFRLQHPRTVLREALRAQRQKEAEQRS